jgi:low temperature requirement protein LtrA
MFKVLKKHEKREDNSSIEWFFDLIFVALIIQLNLFITNNFTGFHFYIYAIILLWLYWVWLGYTIYHERCYKILDDFEKKTIFFKIIFLGLIGASIPGILGETTSVFITFFILVRLMLVILWSRVYINHPQSRPLTKIYIWWFSIGIIFWAISLLFDSIHIQVIFWSLAILCDILTPLFTIKGQKALPSLSTPHYFERFSLFTLIALWEVIITIVKTSYTLDLQNMNNIFWIIFLFYVVYWIYRKYFEEFAEAKQKYDISRLYFYHYFHFFIIFWILLVSIGFYLIVEKDNMNFFNYHTSLITTWLILFIGTIRILESILWCFWLNLRKRIFIFLIWIGSILSYIFEIPYVWAILLLILMSYEIIFE